MQVQRKNISTNRFTCLFCKCPAASSRYSIRSVCGSKRGKKLEWPSEQWSPQFSHQKQREKEKHRWEFPPPSLPVLALPLWLRLLMLVVGLQLWSLLGSYSCRKILLLNINITIFPEALLLPLLRLPSRDDSNCAPSIITLRGLGWVGKARKCIGKTSLFVGRLDWFRSVPFGMNSLKKGQKSLSFSISIS